MRLTAAAALAVAGLLTVGCGGITDPSKNQVETFSGTLQVGGNFAHPFTAAKTGEISVKVTALSPASNSYVGVIWAVPANNGDCSASLSILQQNNFAQVNFPAIVAPIVSGKYCIIMFDAGFFTAPQNYTVSVSHP